jgi:hypothetical protein
MASPKPSKDNLRYPSSIIDATTDYLKIQHFKYSRPPSGFLRTGNFGERGSYSAPATGATTIILPIPSNIQDGNSVTYADDSLDGFTASVYNAIKGKQGPENLSQSAAEKVTDTLTGVFDTIIDADSLKRFQQQLSAQAANIPFGGNLSLSQIVAREEAQLINPNMELLFNGVTLRSFKFSFKMTPRDPGEAKNIVAIIREFKKAMAPKLISDKYLGTPQIFQLTYMKGRDPHPFLHKFKNCFMTDMTVNYTGEGVYATYADGSPISYTMDLGFKEVEPIYEGDYTDSIGGVGF